MNSIRPTTVNRRSLKLTPQERYVLSRVDSREQPFTLAELASLSSIDEARVHAIVLRLVELGAVEVDAAHATTPPPQNAWSVTVSGATHMGIVRTNNEDAFAVMELTSGALVDVTKQAVIEADPRGVLLLISDGMGGANAGEVASALVISSIHERLRKATDHDPVNALAEAIEHANAQVIAAATVPEREGMGATIVAVLIDGENAYTAEVGDSRAYVVRKGAATALTKDQTYVQLLIDRGVLTVDSAPSSRAKNLVLQAIGKAPTITVAQRRLSLRSGDQLLLCSDGLTAYVTDAEIAQVLTGPLDVACAKLIAMANERGGKDNVTVIAALVSSPLLPTPEDEPIEADVTTVREFVMDSPI